MFVLVIGSAQTISGNGIDGGATLLGEHSQKRCHCWARYHFPLRLFPQLIRFPSFLCYFKVVSLCALQVECLLSCAPLSSAHKPNSSLSLAPHVTAIDLFNARYGVNKYSQ